MSNFDTAFSLLMGEEGGYVDNPNDPGGATCWGITERVARARGYLGSMKLLPQASAKAIAKTEYWDPYQCDMLPLPIAIQVFDTSYNGGHPVQWLQKALGVVVDGKMGPTTLAATMLGDVWQIVALFNAQRLRYLASLQQQEFADGRMNRIADNLERGGLLNES